MRNQDKPIPCQIETRFADNPALGLKIVHPGGIGGNKDLCGCAPFDLAGEDRGARKRGQDTMARFTLKLRSDPGQGIRHTGRRKDGDLIGTRLSRRH